MNVPSLPEAYELLLRAAERLDGVAIRTPVVVSEALNRELGCEVFLKCENLQHVSAFKFRGAYNAISHLSDDERERGVVAYSSGNHAQAVALASRLLGTKAVIVMPSNAPEVKKKGAEELGAEVVYFDPEQSTREEVTAEVNSDGTRTLIKPFDDLRIVAGQGTAAMELLQEKHDLDLILVPCGGGGLLSGTALAVRGSKSSARVIGVEPEVADDAARSFRSGRIETVHNPPTISDGTRTHSVGEVTFAFIQEHVDDIVTVTESAIVGAVKLVFEKTRLVVEPSGALGIAALMEGVVPETRRVGVVLSGGNIDVDLYSKILSGAIG